MLVVDGVRYELWTPKKEEQLEEMVKEYSKEIFGNNSIYFDLRQKLTSRYGIVSIPDGYVILLSEPSDWYIVEGELSSHPIHAHITNQLAKFMTGIKNPDTQKELLDALYNEIDSNKSLRVYVEKIIGTREINRFLSDVISKTPRIAVVIDDEGEKVNDACEGLRVTPEVCEFKTYVRQDKETVHAHLFEPLYEEQTHAKYIENEKKFLCIVGNPEHNINRLYDAIGIVEHLKNEHQISPEDAIIDGWTKEFEKQWREYERKKKKV